MEIKATVEQMSAPINCKYKTESGVEREFSYLEVVLNDGLNRIYGESSFFGAKLHKKANI